MAYQVNKTDGTVVATVADGQIDQLSTDLTLIGKNYSGFGESLNENFIKLLENFANTTVPEQPIKGQLWYDSSEQKLKIYNGTSFVPVSSATISTTQPTTLGIGDLWYNDVDEQLYFFDGTDAVLLGPSYSASQGKSGLEVQSILDTLNQTRVITLLYNNGTLLGIFSKDSFTPKNEIVGFTGSVQPGFNAGSLAGIKFNVTASNADALGGVNATTYVRKDTANNVSGQFRVETDQGLIVGGGGQATLTVSGGNVTLANSSPDKNLILNVKRGLAQENAVSISASARTVDIYTGFLDSQVNLGGNMEVGGDVTIRGNLIINDGDVTQVKTSELLIEDKIINLAQTGDSGQNTDENADGGGIVLEGATKHVILWSQDGQPADPQYPELANNAWTSSDDFNLASGKVFKIGGQTVISGNSLGPGITAIPGVTAFGTQETLNVGPAGVDTTRIQNNRISTVTTNTDLEIEPNGTGNIVLVGSPKITGMADPTNQQDASTKEYVDDTIETRDIVFSMDSTDGKSNSYIISNILNNIAPPAYYRIGAYARILCTSLSNSSTQLDINALVSKSTSPFLTDLSGTTGNALTNVSVAQATVTGSSIATTRFIKVFQLLAGGWTHQTDTPLPP